MQASATASLLDADALVIQDTSPDEQRVLVSHTSPPSDVELVTIGSPKVTLVSSTPYTSAKFSPDGQSIALTAPNLETPFSLALARGDGSGLRLLTDKSTFRAFTGRWLWYTDVSGPPSVLYRVLLPDGAPQVVVSFDPPHSYSSGSLDVSVSPDGDSALYCHSPAPFVSDCFLASPLTTVRVPGWARLWRPGWVASGDCTIVDLSGSSREMCHTPSSWISAASHDGSTVALFDGGAGWPSDSSTLAIHLVSVATGEHRPVPAPSPFDLNVYRSAMYLAFTPDDSRLIAFLGSAAFTMPIAGGPWTQIVSDNPPAPRRGDVEVSPDSRIIAAWSEANGLMMSIDGAPARRSGSGGFIGVAFEPADGLGKALFSVPSSGLVMGNADGTGPYETLANMNCEWAGQVALCLRWASGVPNQVLVVNDDGQRFAVTTHDTSNWPTTAQVTAHRLFYISNAGGLYVVNYRKP